MTGCQLTVDVDFATLLPIWAGAVAAGNSELFSLALADLLAEEDAVNIPGTSREYPNWRRRYSLPVEQLSQHALFGQTIDTVADARNTPRN